jgi:hypothetical protein
VVLYLKIFTGHALGIHPDIRNNFLSSRMDKGTWRRGNIVSCRPTRLRLEKLTRQFGDYILGQNSIKLLQKVPEAK